LPPHALPAPLKAQQAAVELAPQERPGQKMEAALPERALRQGQQAAQEQQERLGPRAALCRTR